MYTQTTIIEFVFILLLPLIFFFCLVLNAISFSLEVRLRDKKLKILFQCLEQKILQYSLSFYIFII